jgi:septin family protein
MPILAKGDQFVQLEMSEVKKTLIRNANAHGVQFFDVRGALGDMEDKHLK